MSVIISRQLAAGFAPEKLVALNRRKKVGGCRTSSNTQETISVESESSAFLKGLRTKVDVYRIAYGKVVADFAILSVRVREYHPATLAYSPELHNILIH